MDIGVAIKMGGNLSASDLLIEAPDVLRRHKRRVKGRRSEEGERKA